MKVVDSSQERGARNKQRQCCDDAGRDMQFVTANKYLISNQALSFLLVNWRKIFQKLDPRSTVFQLKVFVEKLIISWSSVQLKKL